jgi:hypothetical protein
MPSHPLHHAVRLVAAYKTRAGGAGVGDALQCGVILENPAIVNEVGQLWVLRRIHVLNACAVLLE